MFRQIWTKIENIEAKIIFLNKTFINNKYNVFPTG